MVSEEVKAYVSSLADLTFNSKPLINMLTMLADENVAHATEIVEVVENHLNKVKTDVKLPILYLIDCIVKNVGGPYTELFSRNIVSTFCNVFKVVDEKTRAEMFKLRQTWNDVFSPKKLYAIDVQIRLLDPAWPVTAPLPSTGNIHINPKFFKTSTQGKPLVPVSTTDPLIDMQQQLLQKQKELLELQLKKSELELLQTKVQYREPLSGKVTGIPQNVLLKPEVAKQLLSSSTSSKNEDKNVKSLNMKKVQIQPANSALVAAAVSRPVRDPRLLKQQQVQQQQSKNTSNINVHLENKNNNENSSNKIVNSKMSVRDDPRLKNNIVPSSTSSQQKFIDDKTKSRNLSKFRNSNKNPSSSSSSSNTSNSPSKKNKSDKTSPIKNSSSSTSTSNRNKRKEAPSIDTKHFKSSSRDLKQSKSDTFLTTVFKDVKTGKNRNFRRKHSPKFSPEPQDVDLRLIGNKDTTTNDKKHEPLIQPIDVDLRQLPIQLNKKRSSTESPERTTKKSKTELMDQLFGNEDTDLRPTMNDRPPTPPPPIISSTEKVDENESKLQKSNLDFVRAKLAANIKKTSPVNKSIKKRSDEDIRVNKVSSSTDIKKIGISKAECDKIIEGGMTSIQQNEIMNKIIAQIEAQKLKEAKKNDLIETTTVNNVSLTPISDEELEFIDENGERRKEIPSLFGDKDERIIPMQMLPDEFSTNKRFARENRRGLPSWRNARGAPNTTRRFWDTSRQQQQQQRPWMNNWTGNFRPPFPEVDRNEIRSPDNDIVVESSSQEDIKTITIDGSPRDIRYYDEIAIIFLNWDDPREISFQDGTRRVIFNDINMYMLNFNEPYREYRIDDDLYQVKLGGPSREIYIDYKPYECYFGGPGITIDLKGKVTTIKLDGPPPQVKIGEPRTDLVAGKIKLIIDAKTIVPIFVDSKLQKFIFNDEEHTVQLNPGLKTVNINNELFDVQFGGLPKPINLKGKKHYIRFSVLPKNVKPGMVKIKGLENDDRPLSPNLDDLNTNEPALPIPQRVIKAYDSNLSPDNSSSGTLFQNVLQQQNLSNLDFLTNVISSSSGQTTNSSSYQIESNTPTPLVENTTTSNDNSFGSINDLFQKLVASGILTTTPSSTSITNKEQTVTQPPQQQQQYQNKEKSKSNKFRRNVPLKPVTFNKPEQLKVRQGILYEKLYSGMQCSSCGMRFPPEQSMYYSQHLDWHFRQNRKGKKNARVASSRKWYYTVSDWQKYEEIENLEEREKNYFDQQQQQAENSTETKKEETELQSVTADPELQDICEVCGDKFDIFFNEDKEEWQFKNAIKDEEDKIYHPICYEEHQQSLLNMLNDEDIPASPSQIPGIEIPNEDENIDEVVLDESEDDKSQNEETSPTTPEYIDEDDDVILKEPTIEEIIVDDDDDFNDIGEETQQTIPSISSPKLSPKIKEIVENLDDGFVDVNEGLAMLQNGGPPIQVKTEPIDEDDLPNDEEMFEASSSSLIDESSVIVENQDDELKETEVEQSRTSFVPSIDGNLEMESSATHPVNSVSGKIKININKPLPVIAPKDNINKDLNKCDTIHERLIDPSQPLPPGEEPVIIQQRKPSLQGIELKDMPPVQRGTEVTGMCSIM